MRPIRRGRRCYRKADGAELTPERLAGRLLAEANGSGAALREYVWLDDMPLAVVADIDTATPKLWFVHADHLDRPIKMTDAAKASVWDAVYRPFGEVHSVNGTANNNLRFPGQYFLIESGLAYNWHRHYDPTLGRYIQPDPLEFVDGPSLYAYAKSTPAIEIDPDGRNILQRTFRNLSAPIIPLPSISLPPIPNWWRSASQVAQVCTGLLINSMNDAAERRRCAAVERRCHDKCVEYAMSHPRPGIGGSDRPMHYVRCKSPF